MRHATVIDLTLRGCDKIRLIIDDMDCGGSFDEEASGLIEEFRTASAGPVPAPQSLAPRLSHRGMPR